MHCAVQFQCRSEFTSLSRRSLLVVNRVSIWICVIIEKKNPKWNLTVSFISLVFWLVLKLPWSHSNSQWHIHWQWQMSKLFLLKSQSDTQTPRFGIRNKYGHHSRLTMTMYYTKQTIYSLAVANHNNSSLVKYWVSMPACVKTLHHVPRNKITQSDLEMHSFVSVMLR